MISFSIHFPRHSQRGVWVIMCKILRINEIASKWTKAKGKAKSKSKWKRLRGALEWIAMDDKRQALGQQIKIDSMARAFSTDLYFLDGYLKQQPEDGTGEGGAELKGWKTNFGKSSKNWAKYQRVTEKKAAWLSRQHFLVWTSAKKAAPLLLRPSISSRHPPQSPSLQSHSQASIVPHQAWHGKATSTIHRLSIEKCLDAILSPMCTHNGMKKIPSSNNCTLG